MNLVVDVGNSRIKTGVFKDKNLIYQSVFSSSSFSEIKKILVSFPDLKFAIVSSVLKHSKELLKLLSSKLNCIELNFNTRLPISNGYNTPETLGNDRLAAAVGAYSRFQKKNCLIVDAGTCIKYDFIDSKGKFHGGAISPGLEMRYKALNAFTDRLPLISRNEGFNKLIGSTTAESILSGVQNGIIEEVSGMIRRYEEQYEKINCVLTGGDCQFFENALKNSIFAAPFLLLEGLNEILLFNVKQNNT
jgi:type III pantothenate kinase